MAVSKRLRYEILRRDGNRCRYCGASADDASLTVDHVIPTALGGSDEASNLVAACKDCNAGKTSSSPDAPLAADVQDKALVWAAAMEVAVAARATQMKALDDYCSAFSNAWDEYCTGGFRDPVWPEGGADSIERFYKAGLPLPELLRALHITMDRPRVGRYEKFRYMCGIGWSVLTELQQAAMELVGKPEEDEEDGGPRDYQDGWDDGYAYFSVTDIPHRVLMHVVEGSNYRYAKRLKWVA